MNSRYEEQFSDNNLAIRLMHWWSAARPKTLLAGVAPVFLGLALFYRDYKTLSFFVAFLTLICTMLLQIGTNLTNDYFDFINGIDGEKRVGPKRASATGTIHPSSMRQALTICFVLALLIGLYLMKLGGPAISILGLTSMAVAFLYTGGPFPLSYYALGELLALIFFGPVAVWGTYYLQAQTIELSDLSSTKVILASLGPGAISACLLHVNNLRDINSDSLTAKKTLAIILGRPLSKVFCLLLGLFPIMIPWMMPSFYVEEIHPIFFITSLIPLLFYNNWKTIIFHSENEAAILNNCLAKVAQYLFLYCILFGLLLNF